MLSVMMLLQSSVMYSLNTVTPFASSARLNITGCYAMAASNGSPPAHECGIAPVHQKKHGTNDHIYLHHKADGSIDACLSQICYRAAAGSLITTTDGVGMLKMTTLINRGNCTGGRFPQDGLTDYLNFVLPLGWSRSSIPANATRGTSTQPGDLSGVFMNNDGGGGMAGLIILNPNPAANACNHMRALKDCTAVPPQLAAKSSAVLQDVKPTKIGPAVSPAPSAKNLTGCYVFGGSAGRAPLSSCGMAPVHINGHIFVSHKANGAVKACLSQFCYRALDGSYSTTSNGVGALQMVTRLGKGSCNKTKSKMFPEDGLFAHIDFIVPAGWPDAGLVTKGANVSNTLPTLSSNSTLAGVFINNGGEHTANVTDTTGNGGLAGWLTMDPKAELGACDHMHQLPDCSDVIPPDYSDSVPGR